MEHSQFVELLRNREIELRINRSRATEYAGRRQLGAFNWMIEHVSANSVVVGLLAILPLAIWVSWWIAIAAAFIVLLVTRLSVNFAVNAVRNKLLRDADFFEATKGTGLFMFTANGEWYSADDASINVLLRERGGIFTAEPRS